MIEIARERSAEHPASSRIEYREGPAEELPVDSDSADLVLAFDSIDHWQDVEQGLSEIRRILRPGGQLVITKDASVPGTTEARRALLGNLKRAGFAVTRQQEVAADEVSLPFGDASRASSTL